MKFNLRQYKVAQQRGRYPSGLLPEDMERAIRLQQDPYRLDHVPGDGKGQKLTTPGSQGMPGDAPDVGAGMGGSNERKGYPTGISQFEDHDRPLDDLPFDSDPEDPFTGKKPTEPFGQGQNTGYGEAMHDDANVNVPDSVLGIHQTVGKDLNDNEGDRKTDISTMQGILDSKLDQRLRNPWNKRMRRSPLDVVRESQKTKMVERSGYEGQDN